MSQSGRELLTALRDLRQSIAAEAARSHRALAAATSSCRRSPPAPAISRTIWRSATTICATAARADAPRSVVARQAGKPRADHAEDGGERARGIAVRRCPRRRTGRPPANEFFQRRGAVAGEHARLAGRHGRQQRRPHPGDAVDRGGAGSRATCWRSRGEAPMWCGSTARMTAPTTWAAMIENTRKAGDAVGRRIPVLMDIAGPEVPHRQGQAAGRRASGGRRSVPAGGRRGGVRQRSR